MEHEHESGVDGHSLLLPFDTDAPDFARGFEAGRIWAVLQLAPDEGHEVVVHAANAEMALRMAEATRRRVSGQESDDGYWLTLNFQPAEAEAPAD